LPTARSARRTRGGVDPALQAQRQAVAGRVDRIDDLAELARFPADNVQDRAEILFRQLLEMVDLEIAGGTK
jgi:hypothetical protein